MSFKPEKEMTEYARMSLAANQISPWWGRLAHLFSWVLIQGYVIFPSTFSNADLEGITPAPEGSSPADIIKRELFFLIQNIPLFGIAWGAVIIGGLGMSYCLIRWHRNFIWGVREIITPGLYASSTGLISAVANIWGLKEGLTSSSKLTLFVTGGAFVLFLFLWIIFKILLGKKKKRHIKEAGYVAAGRYGEGHIQATKPVKGKGNRVLNVLSSVFDEEPKSDTPDKETDNRATSSTNVVSSIFDEESRK